MSLPLMALKQGGSARTVAVRSEASRHMTQRSAYALVQRSGALSAEAWQP